MGVTLPRGGGGKGDRPIVSLLVVLGAGAAALARTVGVTDLRVAMEVIVDTVTGLIMRLYGAAPRLPLLLGLLLAFLVIVAVIARVRSTRVTLCYNLATARNADKQEAYTKLVELREFLRRMSELLTIEYIVDSRGARIVASGRKGDVEKLVVGLRDFTEVFLFTECGHELRENPSPYGKGGGGGPCIVYTEPRVLASALYETMKNGPTNIIVIDWKGALERHPWPTNTYITLSSIKSVKDKALRILEAITATQDSRSAKKVIVLVDPIEMLTSDTLSKVLYAALTATDNVRGVIAITNREDFDLLLSESGEWIARNIRRRLWDCPLFLERGSRRSSAAERPAVGGAPVSPTRTGGLPAHPTPQHTLGPG